MLLYTEYIFINMYKCCNENESDKQNGKERKRKDNNLKVKKVIIGKPYKTNSWRLNGVIRPAGYMQRVESLIEVSLYFWYIFNRM